VKLKRSYSESRQDITSDTKIFDPSDFLAPYHPTHRMVTQSFAFQINYLGMKQNSTRCAGQERRKKRAAIYSSPDPLPSSISLASRNTLVCHQLLRKSIHKDVTRVVIPVLIFGAGTSFKKLDVLPPLRVPASAIPAQNTYDFAILHNDIFWAEFTVGEANCII
jgi:hypothetical protein